MPWDRERRKEGAREAKMCNLYTVDKQMCVLLGFDEKEEIITKKVRILDTGRQLRVSATQGHGWTLKCTLECIS